jgi:hypothetical protein
MPAGPLKTAGIEQEGPADLFPCRHMGMSEDDAVGCRKHLEQAVFDIQAIPGAMTDSDGKFPETDGLLLRETPLRCRVAHIAVHGMDLLAGKGGEDVRGGEVAGMDDHLAFAEDRFRLTAKRLCTG